MGSARRGSNPLLLIFLFARCSEPFRCVAVNKFGFSNLGGGSGADLRLESGSEIAPKIPFWASH